MKVGHTNRQRDKICFDIFFSIGLTEAEIESNAFIFIIAGYETSATVMSFTLYNLAANLDVQKKAQREVDEKLGKVSKREKERESDREREGERTVNSEQ